MTDTKAYIVVSTNLNDPADRRDIAAFYTNPEADYDPAYGKALNAVHQARQNAPKGCYAVIESLKPGGTRIVR